MKIEHVEDYRQARKSLYPGIPEQLDAIWKTLQHLEAQGIDIGPAGTAMLSQITAIKERCPKELPAAGDTPAVVKLTKATNGKAK